MIGQKPDAPQVQVRKNLRPDTDLPLSSALMFRVLGLATFVCEGERRAFRNLADIKSLRGLMQVDDCAASGLGDHLHRAIEDRMAFAQRSAEHISNQTM